MSLTKIILILAASGLVLFLLLLYYTLKDKVSDVSSEEPYRSLVNKPIYLARECLLVKNYPPLAKFEPLFLSEKDETLEERTPLMYRLPKGTKMIFNKIKTVKNGVSGSTSWYLVGKIQIAENNSELGFEYDWPRNYSFLQNKYLSHGTPPWEPCPFNDDIKSQSMAELSKSFAEVKWDSIQRRATGIISPTETLSVTMGGCLRCDWKVSFDTTEDIDLEDAEYWNSKINLVFGKVLLKENERFRDALAQKKVSMDSSLSGEGRRVYTFNESQTDTDNNYLGIQISEVGIFKRMEFVWYVTEKFK